VTWGSGGPILPRMHGMPNREEPARPPGVSLSMSDHALSSASAGSPGGCLALGEDLTAFLDRELDTDARARLEAHLALCPTCAREVAALSRTWTLLERYRGIEASPRFLSRLAAQLSSEPEPIETRGSALGALVPRLAAAAAVVALLGTGYLAWMRLGPGRPDGGTDEVAELSEEERAIIADLGILAEKDFEVVRDMPLVEQLPVLDQLTETDLGSM